MYIYICVCVYSCICIFIERGGGYHNRALPTLVERSAMALVGSAKLQLVICIHIYIHVYICNYIFIEGGGSGVPRTRALGLTRASVRRCGPAVVVWRGCLVFRKG